MKKIIFIITILTIWFLIPEPKKKQETMAMADTVMVTTKREAIGPLTSEKQKKSMYLMVRTTYYNPVEAQCDSNPLVTADGSNINLRRLKTKNLKWLAVSQDLLPEYPFGTKVKVTSKKYPEISGIYEIHDVMNPRFRYSIDVLSHIDHGHVFGTHLTRMEKV